MIKKILSLCLIILLLLSLIPAFEMYAEAKIKFNPNSDTSKVSFKDIKNSDWAKNEVLKLASQDTKILNGYPDGTFKGSTNMTRGEFVVALARALGYEPVTESTFTDVPADYWASKYIGTAQEKGIIEPEDFKKFEPNKDILREELCKMVVKSFKKTKDIMNNKNIELRQNFVDIAITDAVYNDNAKVAAILLQSGILNGEYDKNKKVYISNFKNKATRFEIAAFLHRVLQNYERLENFEVLPSSLAANANINNKEIKQLESKNGIKVVQAESLEKEPLSIEAPQGQNVAYPADVNLIVNKVSILKRDQNYSGEYKQILDNFTKANMPVEQGEADAASLGQKDISEKTTYSIDDCNIVAVEMTAYTMTEFQVIPVQSRIEVEDETGKITVLDLFSDYQIQQGLKGENGICFTLDASKEQASKKYTIFYILDELPKKGEIKISNTFNQIDNRELIIKYGQ